MSFTHPMPTLNDSDHVLGSVSAALLLMTYGNYPCPRTGEAHKAIQNLRSSLGNQLCFIFRHFPTIESYPQSQRTAETAEAAGSQGKFWEMHNKLFENQQNLDDASLVQYASELGLDIEKFLQDLTAQAHTPRVQSDADSGQQHGVKATPTFFIGIRHEGTENLETFVQQILQVAIDNSGSPSA